MLPARMRDTARSELCQESVREFSACTQKAGFALVYACTKERDALVKCIEGWLEVGIRALQVWSLPQFYSVDFSKSRIDVKKCVFNKRTINVCVSCC